MHKTIVYVREDRTILKFTNSEILSARAKNKNKNEYLQLRPWQLGWRVKMTSPSQLLGLPLPLPINERQDIGKNIYSVCQMDLAWE